MREFTWWRRFVAASSRASIGSSVVSLRLRQQVGRFHPPRGAKDARTHVKESCAHLNAPTTVLVELLVAVCIPILTLILFLFLFLFVGAASTEALGQLVVQHMVYYPQLASGEFQVDCSIRFGI